MKKELPLRSIAGLPDLAVWEARERVSAAIRRRVVKLFVDRGAALPQFCGMQFCVEDSFLETFWVFGGQSLPDSRFKLEGPGKPEPVYR